MPLSALAAGDALFLAEEAASLATGIGNAVRKRTTTVRDADVTLLRGADAVSDAAPAWRAIEAAGAGTLAFQSCAMGRAAARAHLSRGEEPRIAIVRERGVPVVVLPMVFARRGGLATLRFLGDPLIQYGDAIAAPEATEHHLEAAWRMMARSGVASLAILRKVREDSRLSPTLQSHARRLASSEAPFVDLLNGCTLGRDDARELRRYRRRLAEHGEVVFAIERGNAAKDALREAIALKRAWLDERGLTSRVIGNPDWEQALHALATEGSGELTVARLSVGGRTAAVEVGLVGGGRWCAFLGALSPTFAKAGPGHVQMMETIAHCQAEGLAVYDLLPPAQPYKAAMATGSVAVHDYAVALDLRGHLAIQAARLLPAAKAITNALPVRTRRALLRFTRARTGTPRKN